MEWKTVKLGEVCSKIGSGATPKGGKDAYLGGPVSLIRSQNVLDFTFSKAGLAYISSEQAKKLNNVEIYSNDVLLNITGDSVARACIVPNEVLPARVNQHVAIIRGDKSQIYNEYILYHLQMQKKYLLSLAQGGATRNALTKGMIEDIQIPLPPLCEQAHIVSTLSSLDAKIENNNRINRNLEAQAQALFKSWFVDFEPWGGTMPEDWKEGTLGEIAVFNKRKVGPKFANPIQYLDTGHLTEGVIEGYQRFYPGDNIPSSARRYVGEGDILFSLCRPNMRHYGLMMNPPEDIVASTGFAVITANWSGYRYYIYQWLKQDGIIDNIHAVAEQSSTTYPTIDVDYLAGMTMVIPSIADTDRYALLCRDLYSKIESNYQENLRLAALRDTLLPKLMKGEIAL